MKLNVKNGCNILLTFYLMHALCFGQMFVQASQKTCVTDNGSHGVCVRLQQCDSISNYVASRPFMGLGKIFNSVCSVGFFQLLVCCPQKESANNNRREPTTTQQRSSTNQQESTTIQQESTTIQQQSTTIQQQSTTIQQQSTTTQQPSTTIQHKPRNDQPKPSNDEQKPSKDDEKEKKGSSLYKPLYPPQCGFSDAAHDRVVGGNPAELGAWPWIAAVGFSFGEEADDVEFPCGGTLISSRHVLTAAHCMAFDGVTYVVRLGELDKSSTTDGAHPIDVEVESFVVHPKYNDITKENDIAILRLAKDVEFTNMIHPICLPIEESIRNRNFVGYFPFVAGWGAIASDGPESEVLLEAQVPVVSVASCKKSYETKKNTVIDDRVICAGYPNGGKDACQGDSGGPLMIAQKATYYLLGVVSTGFKCAAPGFPGVYTRVTYFLDFILSNMK